VRLPPIDSLVLMIWDDAHAANSGWVFRDELDSKLKRIKTVGWLSKITPKTVVVCASFSDDEGGVFSDVTTVPRNCIVSLRKLSEPR
jgi:hypothetical protein